MTLTSKRHNITLSTTMQYLFGSAGYFDSKQKISSFFLTKDMTKRQTCIQKKDHPQGQSFQYFE